MSFRIPMVISVIVLAGALGACQDGVGPTSTATPLAREAESQPGSGGGGSRLELIATFQLGDAKARYRARGDEQELQVEVEDLKPGATIQVLVGGVSVGSATADAFGNTNLNHNTQVDGPFPAGFAVAPGTSVMARLSGTGELVAEGVF